MQATVNQAVGRTDCPICGAECDVRTSKKAKPYIVCQSDECGFQGFARGEGAAIKLRQKMRPLAEVIAAVIDPPNEEDIMPAVKKPSTKKPKAASPATDQAPKPAPAADDFESFVSGKKPAKPAADDFGNWLK